MHAYMHAFVNDSIPLPPLSLSLSLSLASIVLHFTFFPLSFTVRLISLPFLAGITR